MTYRSRPARASKLGAAAIFLAGCVAAGLAFAQPEAGPAWASLSPSQQQALAPLQRDWRSIDAQRKQKWIEVASRFPTLPADERTRIQERMADWARLTPTERARARLQFQEVRQISPTEREARWQAYQALPSEQRQQWVQTAKSNAGAASAARAAPKAASPSPAASAAKSNLIAAPRTAPVRPVTSAVVQAKPGATTTTVTTRPSPPLHQQAGLPKIAATPEFVDPATLLPRRGPQGAAADRAPATPAAPAEPDKGT